MAAGLGEGLGEGLGDGLGDALGDAGGAIAGAGAAAAREAYTVAYDMLGHATVTSSITRAMPTVQWPVSFSNIADAFRNLSLDIGNSWGSLDCNLKTNYCQKTLYVMICFGAFAAGIPLCGGLLRKRWLRPRLKWTPNRLKVLEDRQIRLNLVIFTSNRRAS